MERRPPRRAQRRSWKDAACELAACGLVAQRERRRVHSSVSGVAPIYYVEHEGAVYFASRIDPLVQALPRRYTIDWRAWASIFYLRFPIGERTPFREVKRLRPFSTLEWDADRRDGDGTAASLAVGRGRADLGLDEGADAVVEAMRATRRAASRGPVICTLSGGWDSRLLLCLLAEQGHDGLQAVTVSPDNGHHREEELAAAGRDEPRSAALHPGGRTLRRSGTTRASARCGWTSSSPRLPGRCRWRLRSGDGPAWRPTASALDTLAQGGTHYYTESMIRAVRHPRWRARAVDSPSWPGHAACDLAHAVAGARRQAEGPRQAPVHERGKPVPRAPRRDGADFYATRTVRGISLTPHAVLGADVATVTPCTDHGVAVACLATRPMEKFHTRIYQALFAKVNATVMRASLDPRRAARSGDHPRPARALRRGRPGL